MLLLYAERRLRRESTRARRSEEQFLNRWQVAEINHIVAIQIGVGVPVPGVRR